MNLNVQPQSSVCDHLKQLVFNGMSEMANHEKDIIAKVTKTQAKTMTGETLHLNFWQWCNWK